MTEQTSDKISNEMVDAVIAELLKLLESRKKPESEPEIVIRHCPFCCCEETILCHDRHLTYSYIECEGCKARGSERTTAKSATLDWNDCRGNDG